MKSALGLGLAALAGVTALSIVMSVVIPARGVRAARAETVAAWTLARSALTRAGASCGGPPALRAGLVAQVVAREGQCVARVTIPADSSVPAAIRGAHLEVMAQGGHIQCRARGGHGAAAIDFPAACRYRPAGMLL